MDRIVSFYEKLPRGKAPAAKPRGLFERYQARYFGKNPSGMRMWTRGSQSYPETNEKQP